MRSILVLQFLCVILAPSTHAQLPAGYHQDQVFVQGGMQRSYDLYLPESYTNAESRALLVDLHGITSNSGAQKARSGFDRVADAHGLIVVYPQGVDDSWNIRSVCCPPASVQEVDDESFVIALVKTLATQYHVESSRIYATGYSNGAGVAARLGCDAADVFAAVAVFSSLAILDPPCQPARPISYLGIHGDTDAVVPYQGGSVLGYMTVESQAEVFEFWKDANECVGDAPDHSEDLGDVTRCESFTQCADGVQTSLCTTRAVEPFGHDVYENQDGIDFAWYAWNFLTRFRLPAVSSEYADRVQLMYVAYYGRPGDPGGIDFWASRLRDSGGDLAGIIDAFGNSAEFNKRFGGLANDTLVNTLYLQLFGRNADRAGLDFYVGRLTNGEQTLGSIALSIADGVREGTQDYRIVSNKLEVANTFSARVTECETDYGTDEIDGAKEIIDGVSEDADSVSVSLLVVDSFLCPQ